MGLTRTARNAIAASLTLSLVADPSEKVQFAAQPAQFMSFLDLDGIALG
jgi:hypothetical protein